MENRNTKSMRVAALIAAAVGFSAYSNRASASEDGLTSLATVDSIKEVRQLEDGSIELVLETGQVVKIDPDSMIIKDGQILVPDAIINALYQATLGGDNALLFIGALLVAGGGLAAAGLLVESEETPLPPENQPTTGSDVLEGTEMADTIDGLGGNDNISGLGGNDTLIGNTGNDTLIGGAGADTLNGGAGDDVFVVDGSDTVIGGDGSDTLSFFESTAPITSDLGAETFSVGGGPDQSATSIENVIGSNFDDTITGNDEDNLINAGEGDDTVNGGGGDDGILGGDGVDTIDGGAGDDTISGGFGIDILDGGDGTDTNSFAFSDQFVVADLRDGTAQIGAEIETFVNFENLEGSAFDDELIGNDDDNTLIGFEGDDILRGNDGDDILNGGAGADFLDGGDGDDTLLADGDDAVNGGDGIDTIDFSGLAGGINVDLAAETFTNTDMDQTVLNVENIVGSSTGDTLIGDDGVNIISGGAGNDLINGGLGADILNGDAGNDSFEIDLDDIVDGGDDIDTIVFSNFTESVTANLATQTFSVGGVMGQTFSNIEGLTGTAVGDFLTGSDGADAIIGGAGSDLITGGAGNDLLTGDAGGAPDGTADIDVFVFDAMSGTDQILDFQNGVDVIDITAFGPGFDVAAIVAAATEANGNVTITLNDDTSIILIDFALADLDQSDFGTMPAFTSGTEVTVAENVTDTGYIAMASDIDGDTPTFLITGGADGALFSIDAMTGALSFLAAPDFEMPGDADGDNVFEVEIGATDGDTTTTQTVSVTVTNVNDNAPAFTSGVAVSVVENQTDTGYIAAADDPDGDPVTFAITGGADAALFSIDETTGALSFLAAPDFEMPGDADMDNVFDVEITASDGTNATAQSVAVTVTDQNENAPVFTSGTMVSVAENETDTGYVATATDADGDTPTFAINGGADGALFTIDAMTGALSFISAPDFDVPGDSDGDNVFDVEIAATDGVNTTLQTVSVTLTNVNDNIPVFTSGDAVSVVENQTDTGYIATAPDADGDEVTFSITGGADAALFTIDAMTGALSFVAAPDFEMPGDADMDNVFDVEITATDGTTPVTQLVAVTVTDENENAPVFTSGTMVSVAENETDTGYVATATDADGDMPTFSINGGADAALFTIDAMTGALSFVAAPDFEMPGDADMDNVFDVEIAATDGVNTTLQTVSVTVTDLNDTAPEFTSGTAVSVAENLLDTGYVAAATDAEGDPVMFAISGGADAALFSIDAMTGVLSFLAAPDFEMPSDADMDNVFDVEISATDGTNTSMQSVAVTLTNENDNSPVFTSGTMISVAENETDTGYVAAATDDDGDTVTFSITGGADAGLFSIDADTGALSFVAAPDFETPSDADMDNVFNVEITASDGTNMVAQTVDVTVTDVAEMSGALPTASQVKIDLPVFNDLSSDVRETDGSTFINLAVDLPLAPVDGFEVPGLVEDPNQPTEDVIDITILGIDDFAG